VSKVVGLDLGSAVGLETRGACGLTKRIAPSKLREDKPFIRTDLVEHLTSARGQRYLALLPGLVARQQNSDPSDEEKERFWLALDKRFINTSVSENPNLKLNGEGNGERRTHFAGHPGERSTFLGM
jgi:hypothetical protein